MISDYHAPYNHPDAYEFLKWCKATYKPTEIVCIGDEVDFHDLSFHDSDKELDSSSKELEKAIVELNKLYKIFPVCTVIESNHGSMVLRKAKTNGIPLKAIKSYNEILDAPKTWVWKFDHKINTRLGPIYFCHGKSGAAGRLASNYGMSCIQGHYHEKAQITYISTPEKLMFDAHTGCLADDKSLALGYNKINPRRPIVSLIVVVDGIPQIVPMVLNKKGRWIKP